jgi:carbamoyltransferase
MYILGLSFLYHDSAAVLIKDGEILSAVEEERFSRVKHDKEFPLKSILYCLKTENIELKDIDAIVFYDKPFLKFDRLLETFFTSAPFELKSFLKAIPIWLKEKIYFKRLLRKKLLEIGPDIPKIYFSEHHLSHAASAFYPSGLSESSVLCIDGVGEWATTSGWFGSEKNLKPLFEIHFPHSLGLFYSAFTAFLGFKVNSGEYKMMGLAPYGKPIYSDLILKYLIDLKSDGSFQLNLDYLNFVNDSEMFTMKFCELFKHQKRLPDEEILEFHKDLSASVQVVLEMAVFNLALYIKGLTKSENLVLAGGVALNCVANGKLFQSGKFKNIWVQPASGDSGGALGAALAFYFLDKKRNYFPVPNAQKGSLLGPEYSNESIREFLITTGLQFSEELNNEKLDEIIASEIINGKVIGFFQGKMEFGPRALGARSIIGDPRDSKMKSVMNLKIKKRESFRPFAAAIIQEEVETLFHWNKECLSPYMLFTTQNKNPQLLPATTHVDGSTRIQLVDKEIHPRFYKLLKKFYEKTGCPVLINTSFNVRGEPIVCSPEEALSCFMTTDMDILILENFILQKSSLGEVLKMELFMSAYAED